MPSIPIWLQASDVVNIKLTQQDLATSGALTDTSGPVEYEFLTLFSNIAENLRDVLKEVNYAGSTREHYIKLASTFDFSVSYLLTHVASTDPAFGKKAMYSGRIFKVTFKYGTSTGSVETITCYARVESHSTESNGRGEVMGKFTLKPVDTGSGAYFVRAIS